MASLSSSSFGLAIVGCGQIVTHHLAALSSIDKGENIKLRALCDPSSDRRIDISQLPASQSLMPHGEQEVGFYETLDDLVSDVSMFATIDIIFIAVPHDLHESLTMQALACSDKIIVLEKPLAPTLSSCDHLVQASQIAAKSNNSMLIVAEQSPYWQEVVLAKRLIADGAIGTIVTAASYYYESMRTNHTSGDVDATGGLGWRGSVARAGGGITIDGGLHWIRPLREMLGRIEQVVAVTRTGLQPELKMEGETLAHAIFKIAPAQNGLLAQPPGSGSLVATYSCNMLATAPMAHDTCPYFRITGTQGELIIHGDGLLKEVPGAGGLRLYDEEHPTGKELFDKSRQGGFFLGFAGLWNEIHRICVERDEGAAHDTVVRAADDVRVALAIYKSAESGQWERT